MNQSRTLFFILIGAVALAGCAIDRLPFVYKPDMHQGMIITQDMVNQLRPGMTRRQVEFVMGPPTITDSFHPNRWDYIQAKKPGGERFESQRVTVFFEGDKLESVSGDLQPADPALRKG